MKIKEYNQMMSYLTRPGVPKKDDKMEDEKKIAEKQMIKVARQPDSRGVFQKAVKEDEKKYQDSLKPLIDPQHFVDVSNTYDGTNYIVDENGQITDEKSLKERFEKEEIEATPEQFRDLAYRLEKNRQMTGAKPTKLNDLKNNFKEKPFIKKKINTAPLPNITFPNYSPPTPMPKKTAEDIRIENNYNKILEERALERNKRNTKGLMHLLPGVNLDD